MISEIIGIEAYQKSNASCICLGTFDGFHKGHQKLAEQADFMLTFDPHPKNVLAPHKPVERLTTTEELAPFLPQFIGYPIQ